MGKKNNRACIICGRGYSYCSTCGEDAGKPSWYSIFDGKNCHDIYEVCTQYRDGVIDSKKAYEVISKLDISDIKNFNDVTKSQIEEIISKGNEAKPTNIKKTSDNTKSYNKK